MTPMETVSGLARSAGVTVVMCQLDHTCKHTYPPLTDYTITEPNKAAASTSILLLPTC